MSIHKTPEQLIEKAINYSKAHNPSWNFSESDERYLTQHKILRQSIADLLSQAGTLQTDKVHAYFRSIQSRAEVAKDIGEISSLCEKDYPNTSPVAALYLQIILGLHGNLSTLNYLIGILGDLVSTTNAYHFTSKKIQEIINEFIKKRFKAEFKKFTLNSLKYSEVIDKLIKVKGTFTEHYTSFGLQEYLQTIAKNQGSSFSVEKLFQLLKPKVFNSQENVSEETLNAIKFFQIETLFEEAICSTQLIEIIEKDISVVEKIFNTQTIGQFLEDTKNADLNIDKDTKKFISNALKAHTPSRIECFGRFFQRLKASSISRTCQAELVNHTTSTPQNT